MTTTTPSSGSTTDDTAHAVTTAETAEVLRLVAGWLISNPVPLSSSLRAFIGCDAYDLPDLHADLTRLANLLDGGDPADPQPTTHDL